MSDRVVVMNRGVIQQIGDPRTIYARPANTFVANFIGVANLMDAVLLGRSGEFCELEIALGESHAPLRVQAAGGESARPGQKVTLSLRPEDIAIHFEQPSDIANGNLFKGEVVDTIYLGNMLECRIKVGRYEVGIQIDHYEQMTPRQEVYLSFSPDHGLCLTE
jgi:putative spermidine/putrescine transport system ATP-binding protein